MEDNTYKHPDGIDHTEDSGFASIAGSSNNDNPDYNLIPDGLKFSSIPVKDEPQLDLKKIKSLQRAEAKRKAEEEYNKQKQDLMYKRLTHLVSKSKFFSSRIIDKLDPIQSNESDLLKDGDKENRQGKSKKQSVESDELDEPPVKRSKRTKKKSPNNSKNKKIVRKTRTKKLNLSQDEIENELSQDSDEDDNNQPELPENFDLEYFVGELRDYQKKGLKWLIALYENGLNGILADEMGLGKTIQVIALISYLLEKKQLGPFLIIAPLSTIPNWKMEFERFAPDLPVLILHGTPEEKIKILRKMKNTAALKSGYRTLPITLTTYEVAIAEHRTLSNRKWRYIVVDEGQRIKNRKCLLVRYLNNLKSISRLILTGTPLQNDLKELWSLLNFLMPDIFNDLNVFKSWFDPKELENAKGTEKFLQQEQDKHVIACLRQILKPFMLRREKEEVCKEIPKKKEIIVYTPITELQKNLYSAVLKYDYDSISMKPTLDLVVDVNGVRPKRKCTRNNKYSDIYTDPYAVLNGGTSSFSNPDYQRNNNYQMENIVSNNPKTNDKVNFLDTWKNFTDINMENSDFFIRIRPGFRPVIYRQIVNHPYLIHCPLDDSGLPRIDEDLVRASGKLLVLDLMLKKLYSRGHKVLLFSTLRMALDLIADYLTMRPWKFVMLTGDVRMNERNENINQFNNDPDTFIFLITTRAGGVGLNLIGADTVILYDSDWNPQVDLQAMARCHRIGQTRPVVTYRLCTKGTIDETIIRRGESKRKLEKMVISKDWGSSCRDKTEMITELKQLLESKEQKIVTSENDVFTEAELEALLDRSDLMPNPILQEIN